MNSIKALLLFLLAGTVMIASCSKMKYKKTKGGMPYQLFRSKDTQSIHEGDYIKLAITQKVNDSVVFSTQDGIYQYQKVDQPVAYDVSEVWTMLHLNDSIVSTQLIDTFMARNPGGINPKFKKGDKIITEAKVIGIFTSDSSVRVDYDKSVEAFKVKEEAMIQKYLKDKNITTTRTKSGTFVEIITPGTGPVIDSGKYVGVKYTGKSWSGHVFDSNTDPSFPNHDPLPVTTGSPGTIKGFDEGIQALQMGTKARLYIPTMIGYGPRPDPATGIKPFEALIFDIEVVSVATKDPAAQAKPMTEAPPQVVTPSK